MSLSKLIQLIRDVVSIRQRIRSGRPRQTLQLIECSEPGGAERMLLQLAANLREPYSAMIGLLMPGWLEDEVIREGMPYARVGREGRDDLSVLCDVLRLIESRSIDILHAHEFYMSVICAVASILTRLPLFITIHGKNYYPDNIRRRFLFRVASMQATRVIAVSDDLKRFFCASTRCPASQVVVIRNGVEVSEHPLSDLGVGQRIGVLSDAKVVGTVGALVPVKGHLYLIRALSFVHQSLPGVHLIILGEGDERQLLCREIARLGLERFVHLLGLCENVREWLGIMDVFAMPSLSEGLPLALLEAMAAARPTVSTNVGGVPEVVVDGKTGYLVPPRDPRTLAEKLLVLLRDPEKAASMGLAGCKRVQQHYSLLGMVREYEIVYGRGCYLGKDRSRS